MCAKTSTTKKSASQSQTPSLPAPPYPLFTSLFFCVREKGPSPQFALISTELAVPPVLLWPQLVTGSRHWDLTGTFLFLIMKEHWDSTSSSFGWSRKLLFSVQLCGLCIAFFVCFSPAYEPPVWTCTMRPSGPVLTPPDWAEVTDYSPNFKAHH